MKYELFTGVALATDLPKHQLHRGDVATIVESHPGAADLPAGYTLEVFNAVGDTIAVVTVRETQVEPLSAQEVLHVRRLEPAAA